LVQSLGGLSNSIQSIFERFNVSELTRQAIVKQLPQERLVNDSFILDREELIRHAPLTSVKLENSGILIAPAEDFNNVFQKVVLDRATNEVRFTTEGWIIEERIRLR